MRHPHLRAGIGACTRGGGLLEYILLIGAVVLIVIGGFKLFGGALKSTISGQAASVEALDEARPGDGAEGPGARGNSTNTSANEKSVAPDEAKGARGAGPSRGDGADTSAPTADGKMTASTKATTAVPVAEGSGVISNQPRPDAGLGGFDYGWILAGVGVVALAAVLFKGKRQAAADAGSKKK